MDTLYNIINFFCDRSTYVNWLADDIRVDFSRPIIISSSSCGGGIVVVIIIIIIIIVLQNPIGSSA